MKHSTLCYIENDKQQYLLMHRVKKENDENEGKWIGVGGKMAEGESPFDCMRREILEETGLLADTLHYRGFITFVSMKYGTEYMHLFTCSEFHGELQKNCEEGIIEWVDKSKIYSLPLWEGDAVFLQLIEQNAPFFSLKLNYDEDGHLLSSTLDTK